MRIAITVDPEIPIPPTHYGGIERVVAMLVDGLVEQGYDVLLFANGHSSVSCRLEPYVGLRSQSRRDSIRNMMRVVGAIVHFRPDVVHSFGRLAYLLPLLPLPLPKLMSYQREIAPRSIRWGHRLSRGSLHFVGCSEHLIKPFLGQCHCHVVYNGAPVQTYRCRSAVDRSAPLVFLGRVERIKGPHLAIEVARRAGRSLVIAGNIPTGTAEQSFFQEAIQPHIDGSAVQYVGPVTDTQKNDLLGHAAALLMPIQWEEPFGIVMAEALACGTPVIGLRRGSVPEVVQNGVNGFVCGSVEEMVQAVDRLNQLDRTTCRRIMEEKFSDRAMVDAYVRLYSDVRRNCAGRKEKGRWDSARVQ